MESKGPSETPMKIMMKDVLTVNGGPSLDAVKYTSIGAGGSGLGDGVKTGLGTGGRDVSNFVMVMCTVTR